MSEEKVRYAELLPHEFRSRLAARPVAYLPLGTLEWHGEHLPLGSDGIISEGLMIRCARTFGGIVLPPIHLGPDRTRPDENGLLLQGMDYASRVTDPHRQLDGSCYWVSTGLFAVLIDAILEQVRRAGFRAVLADGHGPSRSSWCAGIEEREARFHLKLLGAKSWPESWEEPDGSRRPQRDVPGHGSAPRPSRSRTLAPRSIGVAAGSQRRRSPRFIARPWR